MVRYHRRSGRVVRWGLAAAFALVVLAGCEHGNLAFDHSTGTFSLPVGAGSHESLTP